MPVESKDAMYTVKEAAKILKLEEASVRRYCNCVPQKIVAEKAGRDWLIKKSELNRFNKKRRSAGRPRKAG